MTKIFTALSLLFVIGLPLACKSSENESESKSQTQAQVPCTCGTPEADIEGCAHALCLAGKTNPDNPDCVCGALMIEKK
jgi:hypothetical protein